MTRRREREKGRVEFTKASEKSKSDWLIRQLFKQTRSGKFKIYLHGAQLFLFLYFFSPFLYSYFLEKKKEKKEKKTLSSFRCIIF